MPDREQEFHGAAAHALSGQVLEGSEGRRYPLGELIGEGGQGWVFRATWNGSIDVVVKVMRPDSLTTESVARFQREAEVLKTISQQASPNPHVVRFFDHAYGPVQLDPRDPPSMLPFTVLEYVDGITLERALTEAHPGGVGLSRARRILKHVASALRDVHAHDVIHRDLKPSNILLAGKGAREIAKVTDFGLAKLLTPGLLQTTALAGATVGYAPPEQFEMGNARVGRHTDVFSLAAIFYELVCGLPAFPFHEHAHPVFTLIRILNEERPAFARVLHAIPPELARQPDAIAALDAELSRAFSLKPDERHATIVELQDAIEHVLSALEVTLPSAPPPPRSTAPDVDLARTVRAEDVGHAPEAVRVRSAPPDRPGSAPPPSRSAKSPLAWRSIGVPVAPGLLASVSVTHRGDVAFGAGQDGLWSWTARGWGRMDLAAPVDPRSFRVATWHNDTAYFAGASPIVLGVTSDGRIVTVRFDVANVVFHAASADATGILLAGERASPHGAVAIIAEIPFAAPTRAPWLVDVPRGSPLRAIVRTPGGLVACGDAGTLIIGREGRSLEVTRPCTADLTAALASLSGSVIVVGRGGFVFHVTVQGEPRLEAMPTTRDLLTLASGPDGLAWCGGAEQRVIKRDPEGWVRMGSLPGSALVRALHLAPSHVLAFMDDGGVLASGPP